MRKNRLPYFLGQLTLTLEEFAAESGIEPERLNRCKEDPDAQTVAWVVRYFQERNEPQEKMTIKQLLSREGGSLFLDDHNLYDALRDYLLYAAPLSKETRVNGLRLQRRELYPARHLVYRGAENVRGSLLLFCRRAILLRELQDALVLYDPVLLGRSEICRDLPELLSEAAARFCSGEPPRFGGVRCILTAILPNHFLLEVLEGEEPLSVLSFDAVRANEVSRSVSDSVSETQRESGLGLRMTYLFSLTGVRNDSLAGILFLDKTLVSKWRNGRRKLKCYDKILYRLAETICCSGEDNREKLRTLMQGCCPPAPVRTDRELVGLLCGWLTYREEEGELSPCDGPTAQECVRYLVYSGRQGIREAVQALRYCCKQRKTKASLDLHIVCLHSVECLCGMNRLLALLTDDCAHVTLTLGAGLEEAFSGWPLWSGEERGQMSLLLTELSGREALTLRYQSESGCYSGLFIAIPETAALLLSEEKSAPERRVARLYYDAKSVSRLCRFFRVE